MVGLGQPWTRSTVGRGSVSDGAGDGSWPSLRHGRWQIVADLGRGQQRIVVSLEQGWRWVVDWPGMRPTVDRGETVDEADVRS